MYKRQSTHILKKELKKHGHHVLVVTTILPHNSDYIDEDDGVLRLPGIDLKKLYGYRASNIYSFKGMKELKEFQPDIIHIQTEFCLLYTSPSPRDRQKSRMPSSA